MFKAAPEGTRYARWSVIRTRRQGEATVLCKCDCGSEAWVDAKHLRSGRSRSCGCYRAEVSKQRMTRHGMSDTSEHNIWMEMLNRCKNPTHRRWADYGGRGITVCERWQSFENFYVDMGPRPAKHVIDRLNNDGNYEPDNCAWVTPSKSNRNRRAIAWSGRKRINGRFA